MTKIDAPSAADLPDPYARLRELSNPAEIDLPFANHQDRIKTYRICLQKHTEALGEAFFSRPNVRQIVSSRTRFIDYLLIRAWRDLVTHNDQKQKLALIAVGGYGRGELHPHSDVDLLLLAARKRDLRTAESFVQRFVIFLWDIGLQVGQSVRTLRQCSQSAKSDLTIITTLMESRLLAGPETLFAKLVHRLSPRKIWPGAKFCTAKLAERAKRHREFGDTAYRLEPNVKESPGGLRDIQTLLWIAKRHYDVADLRDLTNRGFLIAEELAELRGGEEFLWQVRAGLHFLTKRKTDLLSFDYQRELAQRFGYQDSERSLAVERFMRRYYKTVMGISRLTEMLHQHLEERILLDRRRPKIEPIDGHFQSRNGYIEATANDLFGRQPSALLEIFLKLQQLRPHLKGVRADTIRLIRQHLHLIDEDFRAAPENRELFLKIIRQPQGISHELHRMNRYGVLARYIPAFNRIVGRMQHDLFHVYTVDEHSLVVVSNVRSYADLAWSPELPQCHEIFRRLPRPEVLYLAALFHDIGKGRGGDHSTIGAREAGAFCRLHGLSEMDTAQVEWLVKQHLSMSIASQRQDVSDPDVLNDFANRVGDQSRLDYLYLLTIADMRGTSPSVWNSWKGSLLSNLYQGTSRVLRRGLETPPDASDMVAQIRRLALVEVETEGVEAAAVEQFWNALDDDYFLRFATQEIAWHAKNLAPKAAWRLESDGAVVATRNIPELGGTCVMVFARDRPNLFATITGELDLLNLNVVDARIYTTPLGDALDSFVVLQRDGQPVNENEHRREIRARLRAALAPAVLTPRKSSRPPSRQQTAFTVPITLNFFTDTKHDRTVMELITSDRPGLLSIVARALADHGMQLHNARINTYGERAEDVFTITDAGGRAEKDTVKLETLRGDLVARLEATPKSKAA